MEGTIDIPGVPEGYAAVWHNELVEDTVYWNDLDSIGQTRTQSVRSSHTDGRRTVVFIKTVPPRKGWHLDGDQIVHYIHGRSGMHVRLAPDFGVAYSAGELRDARNELVTALRGLPRVEG